MALPNAPQSHLGLSSFFGGLTNQLEQTMVRNTMLEQQRKLQENEMAKSLIASGQPELMKAGFMMYMEPAKHGVGLLQKIGQSKQYPQVSQWLDNALASIKGQGKGGPGAGGAGQPATAGGMGNLGAPGSMGNMFSPIAAGQGGGGGPDLASILAGGGRFPMQGPWGGGSMAGQPPPGMPPQQMPPGPGSMGMPPTPGVPTSAPG